MNSFRFLSKKSCFEKGCCPICLPSQKSHCLVCYISIPIPPINNVQSLNMNTLLILTSYAKLELNSSRNNDITMNLLITDIFGTVQVRNDFLNDLKRCWKIAYIIRSSALWDIGGTPCTMNLLITYIFGCRDIVQVRNDFLNDLKKRLENRVCHSIQCIMGYRRSPLHVNTLITTSQALLKSVPC